MKLLFSFEMNATHDRAKLLMRTLQRRGHTVTVLPEVAGEFSVATFDAWFFDVCVGNASEWERAPRITELLETYRGVPICISFDDSALFHEGRLTDRVKDRTRLFLSNMLFADRDRYDRCVRDRLGLVYSFIETSAVLRNVNSSTSKLPQVFFVGTLTGTAPYEMCRLEMVKAVLGSGLPFVGGIIGVDGHLSDRAWAHISPPIAVPRLSSARYYELLGNSAISLCPRGNADTTYRFFETLAAGSLALASPLDDVEILGHPRPGEHFDTIDLRGRDVVDKCEYYLKHEGEALAIGRRGRALWDTHYDTNGGTLTEKAVQEFSLQVERGTGICL